MQALTLRRCGGSGDGQITKSCRSTCTRRIQQAGQRSRRSAASGERRGPARGSFGPTACCRLAVAFVGFGGCALRCPAIENLTVRIAASPVPTDERFSKKLLKAMVNVIFVWLCVPADERDRLERIARYALRPPVAQDRPTTARCDSSCDIPGQMGPRTSCSTRLGVSRSTLKRWRKRVQQTPEKPA